MTFKANQLIGLIKFFSNSNYLNALLDGTIYCNSPEFYRYSSLPGIGDKNESCRLSFRKDRDDNTLSVNLWISNQNRELEMCAVSPDTGLEALTMYHSYAKQAWLHCWTVLRIPGTAEELHKLQADIKILKRAFGSDYLFLPNLGDNFSKFMARLKKNCSENLASCEVSYSADRMDHSITCKSLPYQYQRELRFLVGECGETKEPFIFQVKEGFRDLLIKNVDLKLVHKTNKHVFFDLLA